MKIKILENIKKIISLLLHQTYQNPNLTYNLSIRSNNENLKTILIQVIEMGSETISYQNQLKLKSNRTHPKTKKLKSSWSAKLQYHFCIKKKWHCKKYISGISNRYKEKRLHFIHSTFWSSITLPCYNY